LRPLAPGAFVPHSPTARTASVVASEVQRDPTQPAPLVTPSRRRHAGPRSEETLLREVVGVLGRTGQPHQEPANMGEVLAHQPFEVGA
jgi:hypothetical protein